ncbi:LITAF domain-containing protein [Marinicrinis lubricantis]
MQRDTRTTFNQPNRSAPAQANRAVSGQSRAASPQVNRATVSQAGGAGGQSGGTGNVNAVACRKCKSQQVVANKRGYSFAKLFITLGLMIVIGILLTMLSSVMLWYSSIASSVTGTAVGAFGIIGVISMSLALPVSILVGFVGRSEIVNGCMNCGFKWRPAKRK